MVKDVEDSPFLKTILTWWWRCWCWGFFHVLIYHNLIESNIIFIWWLDVRSVLVSLLFLCHLSILVVLYYVFNYFLIVLYIPSSFQDKKVFTFFSSTNKLINLISDLFFTFALAQGKKPASTNIPVRGAPDDPMRLTAAWKRQEFNDNDDEDDAAMMMIMLIMWILMRMTITMRIKMMLMMMMMIILMMLIVMFMMMKVCRWRWL